MNLLLHVACESLFFFDWIAWSARAQYRIFGSYMASLH